MVLDLTLPDISGFDLLDVIGKEPTLRDLPIVIYTAKELNRKEVTKLKRYAKTIVIKDARSPERLLDETALFLHRSHASLPELQRRMLEEIHAADGGLAGRKVLIVDDDLRNIFALSSLLERQQMQVLFAENGRDGIEVLEKDPTIEIVLMDIMMPEMDGYDTMRAIRRIPKFKSLPIITLTAKAMKGDRDKCIAAGASRLHHQAGRRGPAAVADAGVAALSRLACRWTPGWRRKNWKSSCCWKRLFQRFGYDFRAYDRPALRRKLHGLMQRARPGDRLAAAGPRAARTGRRRGACCARCRCSRPRCSTIRSRRASCASCWRRACARRRCRRSGWPNAPAPRKHGRWRSCWPRSSCTPRTEIYATVANEEVLAEAT